MERSAGHACGRICDERTCECPPCSCPECAGRRVDVAAEFPLRWRAKVIRPEWFGLRCRIVVHGGKGNRLIEFANGVQVVAPGNYLRRG